MKVSDAFPSKYIAASDLNGAAMKLIMGVVEMMEVGREKDIKPCLYFKGAVKGMILNKTNGNCIASMHGDDMELWAGKEITIYPTSTDMAGEIVPCIRVLPAGAILPVTPQAAPLPASSELTPTIDPNVPLAPAVAPGNGSTDLDDDIPF